MEADGVTASPASAAMGERKHLTLLFADVAGSFALLADKDPEEARQLTEAMVERMADAISYFEGIVSQVSGDGLMALFGAPASLEDHALRACHAALRMQHMLHAWQPRGAGSAAIRIRVGINTGEVVVAERGHGFDFQYTTFGSAAHLASRLEQAAPPGGILLSAATHALVAGRVQGQETGPLPIKGLAAPVRAFLLTGLAADGPSCLEASPFVGRAGPLAALHALAAHARAGRGGAAAVLGEPGSGKSRLCRHFLAQLDGRQEVRSATGLALVRPAPYRGVIDWLRPGVAEAGSFEAWLAVLGADAAEHAPALRALLVEGGADGAWLALAIGERHTRITRAIVAAVRGEAARRPLVLVGEDLHWMDAATTAVMAELVRGISGYACLLLATARPEGKPGWADAPPAVSLELASLTDGDTKLLLDGLLGGHPSLNPIKAQLHSRTGGNAFFLEETVRTLQLSGVLAGPPGAHYVSASADTLTIPPTVQDLVSARIDRLPVHAKHALRSAAVLGMEFDAVQLSRLGGSDVDGSVARLLQAGFLLRSAGKLTFCHDLCREVAYTGLLGSARRHLHAKAMHVLEAEGTAGSDTLALHAQRGEIWDKAFRFSQAAGRLSLSRSAPQAALPFLEDALAALGHLPEGDATWRDELGLRLELRNTLFSLGRASSIGPHLVAAEARARQLADAPSLARARSQRAHHAWQMGRWSDALLLGQEALAMANEVGDVGLKASTRFFMGLASHALGQYAAAVDLLARNVAQLHGPLARERFGFVSLCSVVSGCYLSISLTELGRFAEAEAAALGAHAIAAEAGSPFDRGQADLAIAAVGLMRGHAAPVIPRLEAALASCMSSNVPVLLPRLSAALALAYALEGRTAEALARAGQRPEESGAAIQAMSLLLSGQALLAAGEVEAARTRANALVAHSRATIQPGVEAWALHLLASSLATGRREEAGKLLAQAMRLARPRGMSPLLARCRALLEAAAPMVDAASVTAGAPGGEGGIRTHGRG